MTTHDNGEDSPTVSALATELNPDDPGGEAEEIIGFLGHLDGLSYDSVLSPEDVADVRAAWAYVGAEDDPQDVWPGPTSEEEGR